MQELEELSEMAKEYTRYLDGSTIDKLIMKDCFKCHVEFKIGDLITTVTVALKRTRRSRVYHAQYWQKVLQ